MATEQQLDELLALERELAGGDGAAYLRILREDALVVVPGAAMGREETAAAIDESGGWDEFSIEQPATVPLGRDAALVSYVFSGRRGEFEYRARLSSAYVREEQGWRMAFHQQTPADA